MKTGLAEKVVLITCATRNHGRAGALAFAEEGAHLKVMHSAATRGKARATRRASPQVRVSSSSTWPLGSRK